MSARADINKKNSSEELLSAMAETMRFELMVGISHTTLPTSHLKPLGQVSMLNYLTHFRLLCQLPFVKKMNFLIACIFPLRYDKITSNRSRIE